MMKFKISELNKGIQEEHMLMKTISKIKKFYFT